MIWKTQNRIGGIKILQSQRTLPNNGPYNLSEQKKWASAYKKQKTRRDTHDRIPSRKSLWSLNQRAFWSIVFCNFLKIQTFFKMSTSISRVFDFSERTCLSICCYAGILSGEFLSASTGDSDGVYLRELEVSDQRLDFRLQVTGYCPVVISVLYLLAWLPYSSLLSLNSSSGLLELDSVWYFGFVCFVDLFGCVELICCFISWSVFLLCWRYLCNVGRECYGR